MKEKSLDWLRLAVDDFGMAELLLERRERYAGGAAYHMQQSAEKAFKAYLVFHAAVVPKVHDLNILVKRCCCMSQDFELVEQQASRLDPFSIKTRYPDDVDFVLSYEEALELLDDAAEILKFVEKKIKSDTESNMNIF